MHSRHFATCFLVWPKWGADARRQGALLIFGKFLNLHNSFLCDVHINDGWSTFRKQFALRIMKITA